MMSDSSIALPRLLAAAIFGGNRRMSQTLSGILRPRRRVKAHRRKPRHKKGSVECAATARTMDSNHDMDLVRAVLGPAPDHEAQAKLAEAMDIASARRRDAQDAWLAAERARLKLRERERHAHYVTKPRFPLEVRVPTEDDLLQSGIAMVDEMDAGTLNPLEPIDYLCIAPPDVGARISVLVCEYKNVAVFSNPQLRSMDHSLFLVDVGSYLYQRLQAGDCWTRQEFPKKESVRDVNSHGHWWGAPCDGTTGLTKISELLLREAGFEKPAGHHFPRAKNRCYADFRRSNWEWAPSPHGPTVDLRGDQYTSACSVYRHVLVQRSLLCGNQTDFAAPSL